MNEIENKFLLARDKFTLKMHLRQSGFTYSACGPFTKNKERIQKFIETEDSWYIYQNELDKASFQQDVVYGDFKYLTWRTASDKRLHEKTFSIAKNPTLQRYCFNGYKSFDEKTSATHARSETLATQNKFAGSGVKNKNISNKELPEELLKPVIRKF